MIHPDTQLQFISEEVGYGVFATRRIPRGTITWVLDELDQRITPARFKALGPAYEPVLRRFGFRDAKKVTILSWDHARYVNHSCRPSTASGGDDRFEIAIRDIEAGEQITDDYGEFDSFQGFRCRCGSPSCRGEVRPHDRLQTDTWVGERVSEALELVRTVPQPLRPLALAYEHLAALIGAEGILV